MKVAWGSLREVVLAILGSVVVAIAEVAAVVFVCVSFYWMMFANESVTLTRPVDLQSTDLILPLVRTRLWRGRMYVPEISELASLNFCSFTECIEFCKKDVVGFLRPIVSWDISYAWLVMYSFNGWDKAESKKSLSI